MVEFIVSSVATCQLLLQNEHERCLDKINQLKLIHDNHNFQSVTCNNSHALSSQSIKVFLAGRIFYFNSYLLIEFCVLIHLIDFACTSLRLNSLSFTHIVIHFITKSQFTVLFSNLSFHHIACNNVNSK